MPLRWKERLVPRRIVLEAFERKAEDHLQAPKGGESWTSVVLRKTLIFRPYNVLSICSFQPAHGEMTLSGLLKCSINR
jgi:hypothetical protein